MFMARGVAPPSPLGQKNPPPFMLPAHAVFEEVEPTLPPEDFLYLGLLGLLMNSQASARFSLRKPFKIAGGMYGDQLYVTGEAMSRPGAVSSTPLAR